MKTIILFFAVILCTLNYSSAQIRPLLPKYYLPIDHSKIDDNKNDSSESNEEPKKQTLLKFNDRFTYSVNVGAGYSSFSNNLSMMSSYIAPSINYQAGDKLFININGIITQNSFDGAKNSSSYSPVGYNSNSANYGINGSVYYQLSNKWSIFGDGAYYENQSIFSNYQNQNYNTDYKSISLGFGYKISDKVHIKAQFEYSNGLNPAFNQYSPFFNSISPNRSGFDIWDY